MEVTLALGIITFGLIAVMGLLPTGLRLAKQSADEVTAVSIMTRKSANFTNLISGNATYNAQGIECPPTADATYAAKWDIRPTSVPLTALITVSWPANTTNYTGSVESIVVLTEPPH
ncbi:MAG: hypothetical protein WCH98_00645 [Verrucomicrobiota bacterium]